MILRRYEEFFNAEDYESFKKAVVNLAVNNPNDCADLLLYVLHSDKFGLEGNPFGVLMRDESHSRFLGRRLPVDFSQDDTFLMYQDFLVYRDCAANKDFDGALDEQVQDLEFLVETGQMSQHGLHVYREVLRYRAFLHDRDYLPPKQYFDWEHGEYEYEKFQRDAFWNSEFQQYKEYMWHREQQMRQGREDVDYLCYKNHLQARAFELHRFYQNRCRADQEREVDEGIQDFIKLCAETHVEQLPEHTRMVEQVLRHLYGYDGAEAIKHFLQQADMETIEAFAIKMMNPDELARIASVDIVVRKVGDAEMKGNLGRYRIYTRKNTGEEDLLAFSYKDSVVYYLMFLIDRKNKTGRLKPVGLVRNKEKFLELYSMVYSVANGDLSKRFQDLIHRIEGNMVRVGRLNEKILDIRKHLEEAFVPYEESYFPYAMTAGSHLAISPDRIHFEGEAKELLTFSFQG